MRKTNTKLRPNFGPQSGPNSASTQLSDTEVTHRVSEVLRDAYQGNLKLAARDADVGVDTAKNWLEGRNAPRLADFFRLARNCAALRAEALRLMQMDADLDPRFMRDVMAMMQTWEQRRH